MEISNSMFYDDSCIELESGLKSKLLIHRNLTIDVLSQCLFVFHDCSWTLCIVCINLFCNKFAELWLGYMAFTHTYKNYCYVVLFYAITWFTFAILVVYHH